VYPCGDFLESGKIDAWNSIMFSTEHRMRRMAPHALVLSALHALARRGKPTTGRALVEATTLDRDAVLAAVRILDRRGLVRPVGHELRLTLAGFAVASAHAARLARRGQVLVLPLRAREGARAAA
jgi:hypothetical protein